MMGAAIFEQDGLAYRPTFLDRVEVYPAEDGEYLFQVYKREKCLAYWLLRYSCRLARIIQHVQWWALSTPEDERIEVTNTSSVERQGLWDSEEKAIAECLWLAEVSEGKAAVGYQAVQVNRAPPYKRHDMRGLTDPTKWFFKGGTPFARKRAFTMIEESELEERCRELEEWRRGERVVTDCDRRAWEMEEKLPAIDSRLSALEGRVQLLEGEAGHAGSVT